MPSGIYASKTHKECNFSCGGDEKLTQEGGAYVSAYIFVNANSILSFVCETKNDWNQKKKQLERTKN